MKIRFQLLDEINLLVSDIEGSANVKGLSGWQKVIYRTAKGLLKALREENKRTPALFENRKEISDEMRRYLQLFTWKYEELQKIGRQLHRLDENKCNYELTPRQEKRERKLEQEAQKIAGDLGFNIYHLGDPRGLTLWLIPKETKEPHINYHSGIPVFF